MWAATPTIPFEHRLEIPWTARIRGSAQTRTWARVEQCTTLTVDPLEKYDMTFNGAVPTRFQQPSPGKYAGQDNGWVLALIAPAVMEFNKSIVEFPSIKRCPGGASNDWRPNLQNPQNLCRGWI